MPSSTSPYDPLDRARTLHWLWLILWTGRQLDGQGAVDTGLPAGGLGLSDRQQQGHRNGTLALDAQIKREESLTRVSGCACWTVQQARAIAGMKEEERPKVFVSASAAGFYPTGIPGPEVDEDYQPRADSWFGELTETWENAADEAKDLVRRRGSMKGGTSAVLITYVAAACTNRQEW